MKIRIQVVIEAGDGNPEKIEEIARLERGSLRPDELGLTLAVPPPMKNGPFSCFPMDPPEVAVLRFG